MTRAPIVLLASMPRAGSTWTLRMLNELWMTNGGTDYLDIRSKYRLEREMTLGSALVMLQLPHLLRLIYPALKGESYVVKTHSSPNAQSWRILSRAVANYLLVSGWMIPIYIIRDPRDAVLSGHEYGIRRLEANKPNHFSYNFKTIDKGIDWMETYLKTCWEDWKRYESKLMIRYEDLLTDYAATTGKILEYLKIKPDNPVVEEILRKYQPGAEPQEGTHFYKGEIGRFRSGLTAEQQVECNRRYAPYLAEMGYPAE